MDFQEIKTLTGWVSYHMNNDTQKMSGPTKVEILTSGDGIEYSSYGIVSGVNNSQTSCFFSFYVPLQTRYLKYRLLECKSGMQQNINELFFYYPKE